MTEMTPTQALCVEGVRRALVRQSRHHHARIEQFAAALDKPDHTNADFNARDGLIVASEYAWILAAALRFVSERHPDTGFELAGMVETAMNLGTDWLDDANDDLGDETAVTAEAGA